MDPFDPEVAKKLAKEGKRGRGRDRHQDGWVEEVGKRLKRWRGHYYVYVLQSDGSEKRVHKAPTLGLKKEMKKWEASAALQEIIERETCIQRIAAPSSLPKSPSTPRLAKDRTLLWFWTNRFRPFKESQWKVSSRPKVIRFIERYIVAPFGSKPLHEIDRFLIQTQLVAYEKHSRSLRLQFIAYMRLILREAVEQELIVKNPAQGVKIERPTKKNQRVLTLREIQKLLGQLPGVDRLIVRMCFVLGLRPGELFALRRDDVMENGYLKIDESVSEELRGSNKIVDPKTLGSASSVWIPETVTEDLAAYLFTMPDQRPTAWLFKSEAGTPLLPHNYLARILKPAASRAGVEGVNFRLLRRSCGTLMQSGKAGVKDIQAHLRHSSPDVTMRNYIMEIPQSVRAAVENLDSMLRGTIQ
jgi:integrase